VQNYGLLGLITATALGGFFTALRDSAVHKPIHLSNVRVLKIDMASEEPVKTDQGDFEADEDMVKWLHPGGHYNLDTVRRGKLLPDSTIIGAEPIGF